MAVHGVVHPIHHQMGAFLRFVLELVHDLAHRLGDSSVRFVFELDRRFGMGLGWVGIGLRLVCVSRF